MNNHGKYKKYHLLEENFSLETNYFFKELKPEKFVAIGEFLDEFFSKGESDTHSLEKYFGSIKNLHKSTKNIENLKKK